LLLNKEIEIGKGINKIMFEKSFEWYTSIVGTDLHNYLRSSPIYEPWNKFDDIIKILNNMNEDEIFENIQKLYPSKKLDMFSHQHIFAKPLLFDNDILNIITSIIQICKEGIQFINDILKILNNSHDNVKFKIVVFDCPTLTLDYFTTDTMEDTQD